MAPYASGIAAAAAAMPAAPRHPRRQRTGRASSSYLPPFSAARSRSESHRLPIGRARAVEDALQGATRGEDAAAEVVEEAGEEGATAICDDCGGRGWLLCGLCEGKKTNVKSSGNRIYRRCPTCRAVGYVLCPSCRVYKCITYPDLDDGELDGPPAGHRAAAADLTD